MGSRKPPDGMLLTTFLENNYDWAQEPHLYIVLQIPQLLTNPAYIRTKPEPRTIPGRFTGALLTQDFGAPK